MSHGNVLNRQDAGQRQLFINSKHYPGLGNKLNPDQQALVMGADRNNL
jgi:hypothetical protein